MHGLLLRGPGGARTIHYPAAAVWDLIARGYSLERVVALTGHIADLDEEGTRALVKEAIREWVAAGYLEEVSGDG
ncbi:MAG TPA: hypothetical protein VFT45_08860 [Longimicrobium sp.]|nr:hypothetical protein [Longimicrobium sp.]